MRETVTEYGLILVGCVVAGIMIMGVSALFHDSSAWKNFVELFINATYAS